MESKAFGHLAPLAIAALLLFAGTIALVHTADDQKDSFQITITGITSMGNYELDLTDGIVNAHNMKFGEVIELDFGFQQCSGVLTTQFNGAPLFGVFINQDVDATYSLGLYCFSVTNVLPDMVGKKFTLTHDGTMSKQATSIPKYIAGYSDNPEDFSTPEIYANFREITVGDIKPGMMYRSASPYPYQGSQRFAYVDEILENTGVDRLLLMNINLEDAKKYCPDECDYTQSLLDADMVYARHLSPALFCHNDQVQYVMDTVIDSEGSIAVSCALGKDRTGYYVAMLEALAGASYREIREDYMVTMYNLYGITEEEAEYEALATMFIDPAFYIMEHLELLDDPLGVDWSQLDMDVDSVDAYTCVYNYLTQHVGMSDERVHALVERLTV